MLPMTISFTANLCFSRFWFFFFLALCYMYFYYIFETFSRLSNVFSCLVSKSERLAPHTGVSMLFHFLEPAEMDGCFL